MLIVDDNSNIHEDFRKVLLRNAPSNISRLEEELFGDAPTAAEAVSPMQFQIDSAYQGDDAVTMVKEAVSERRPYCLAFVDMRMPPGMDGLGTIEQLWQIDPQLQVVICSAYADYTWSEIISRVGQNDRLVILRKPFDNIEVLQLAHTLCTKWDLHQLHRDHLEELQRQVNFRTRELRDSQALFQLILENTNDLITVVDAGHRRVYSSPAHFRLLGYAPEEAAQLPPFSKVHPDDQGLVDDALERAMATGQAETLVCRKQHKQGFYLHFESHISAARDDRGALLYLVITSRDITERQQKEVQVRLQQKLESIGLLAAGIAHEINTPTQFISDNTRFLVEAFGQISRAIDGYRQVVGAAREQNLLANEVANAESLEEECEIEYFQGEIPKTLEQSLDGISRVAKIVRSLKEFSHPGSPNRVPIDLNHAVENAVMVCRHEWKYVADVDLKLDPNLPQVPCLADEFNQAILNLIVNAAHAIGESRPKGSETKGTIGVTTERQDDWAVIHVADTGTGIPEAIRDRIFEPFFTTKPMGKGTGQGLPIVRAVVVGKHQGTIDFKSELGKGTTFTIRLPLTVPAAAPAAAPAAPANHP